MYVCIYLCIYLCISSIWLTEFVAIGQAILIESEKNPEKNTGCRDEQQANVKMTMKFCFLVISHQPCFPHTTIKYHDSHCLQYLVGLHMPKWVRFWIPVSWCCCSISVKKIISILKQHHTSKNIHTYQKCSGEMKLNSLEELQHFIR